MKPTATYVLDSSILIDHLRGHLPARDWLASIALQEPAPVFAYSVITAAELLCATAPKSEETVIHLLSALREVPVDGSIARLATNYIRKWRPGFGVQLPDAIVAATAKHLGAVLVTRDKRHFPMEDVEVISPY